MLYFTCCTELSFFNLFFYNFKNESKTGLAWYNHLPKSGKYCNQMRRTWYLLLFLFHFFENKNSSAESSGQTEGKTGLDLYEHIPESVQYYNQIWKNMIPVSLFCRLSDNIFTTNSLSLTFLFPIFKNLIFDFRVVSACFINMQHELCAVLGRGVHVVSEFCINMLYVYCIFRVVFFQGRKIIWSLIK